MNPASAIDLRAATKSLTTRIFIVCFVSTHIPLIAAVAFLMSDVETRPPTLLLILLVATLIGTVACLAGLWILLRPLKTLTSAIRTYRVDGTPVRMPLKRQDEVGQLASAVTGMVAEVEGLMQQLRHQALTDPLTGLGNRRWLNERVAQEMARAERQSEPLSIILFDLDHFKQINDKYGHDIGDTVLVSTGEVVSGTLRSYDLAARIGGEEFCIVLPKTGQADAAVMAERLRSLLATTLVSPLRRGRLTASFGVYEAKSGESLQQMLTISDKALYQAKQAGRNCVRQADARLEA